MCFGKTTRGVDRLNSDKKYLVNAEVWTGTGERLKKGVIVLEGGRIAQAGEFLVCSCDKWHQTRCYS